jgi:tRNA(fMet)-specific endonuclease VapC
MIDCTVDSNTIIDALRGEALPDAISVRFNNAGISHVALGELLLGVLKSSNRKERDNVAHLVRGMTLLHGDERTAVVYAGIRNDLERQGNMIPQNDIWIAAASVLANVPLLTRDQHFRRISQLQVVDY